jgi:hypothetical protein
MPIRRRAVTGSAPQERQHHGSSSNHRDNWVDLAAGSEISASAKIVATVRPYRTAFESAIEPVLLGGDDEASITRKYPGPMSDRRTRCGAVASA